MIKFFHDIRQRQKSLPSPARAGWTLADFQSTTIARDSAPFSVGERAENKKYK